MCLHQWQGTWDAECSTHFCQSTYFKADRQRVSNRLIIGKLILQFSTQFERIIKDIFTIQNFAYFSLIKKRKHLLILKGHLAVDASSSSLSEWTLRHGFLPDCVSFLDDEDISTLRDYANGASRHLLGSSLWWVERERDWFSSPVESRRTHRRLLSDRVERSRGIDLLILFSMCLILLF